MKALFGLVSVLVILALVALIVAKQSKTTLPVLPASGPAESGATSVPAVGGNGREQSQRLQQRVRDDVAKAMEQGAAARANEADK